MFVVFFFHNKKICPKYRVSILSRLTHWWMNGLIILGNKRDLKSEDLWGLEKREISDQLTKKFESNWSALTNK